MTEPSKTTWRSRFKLLAFSLTPLVVLMVLGTLMADLITHRSFKFEVDSLTGMTVYTMHVGRLPWARTTHAYLNTLGFPDREFVNLAPKGDCLHVVFSGDSFTFSDAVDGDSTWVSLLRLRTATRHPARCIRIFNIAQRMTTIEQQAQRIRETLPLLRPDIVILGQYQNDLTDLTNPGSVAYRPKTTGRPATFWGDRLRETIPGFSSPLPRMLTYLAFKFLTEQGIRYDVLRRWSVLADTTTRDMAEQLTGIYRDMYAGLVQELRLKNIAFGVVIIPSKMDVMAQRYPEGAFFDELARQYNVPRLALMPVLQANRKPLPYLTYDGHLNERGNRIVARAVYDWLFTSTRPPFGQLADPVPSSVGASSQAPVGRR